MPKVLGLDCSTQSLSAVILDTHTGHISGEVSVNFGSDLPQYEQPSGYGPKGRDGKVHADPLMWLEALDLLMEKLASQNDLSEIDAVSGSGQQHGSVYLKQSFEGVLTSLDSESSLKNQLADCFTRPSAPIWMDCSTSEECVEIANKVGGDDEVCRRTGSIMIERFTGSQIRKFFKEEPQRYAETEVIHLVSSFFASLLAGRNVAIDHGDGAGMNLMNLSSGEWDPVMISATADGLLEKLPPLSPSATVAGPISSYFIDKYGFSPTCKTVIWSGDNPCSLIGMGAASPGKVVISLGTSDTLFAAMPEARTDPQGFGHVFGNPAGGYMSIICFKNGSLAREAVKNQFGLEWTAFEKENLSKTPMGNNGLLMLPFFEAEMTPRIDTGGPVFSEKIPPDADRIVRAILESQFLNMRFHSSWLGVDPARILVTGGASQNDGIAQVIANVFDVPVDRSDVPGSAAIGAGMRAAHAMGEDLAKLEAQFSQIQEGKMIRPEEGARYCYDRALLEFQELLETRKVF